MDQTWVIGDVPPSAHAAAEPRRDSLWQSHDLRPDLSISLLDGAPAQPLRVSHAAPGAWNHLLILLQGRVDLLPDARGTTGSQPPLTTGRLHRVRSCNSGLHLALTAGETVRGIMVHASASMLRPLLPDDNPACGPEPVLDSRPAGAACLRVADSLFVDRIAIPGLQTLMLESRCLELLALALADLAQPPADDNGLSRREHRLVADARDRLLADLTTPPSLRQLADAVGLNEKRLNEGFKALFGVTVFECLRNARLEKARCLLFQEELPLKAIAWQVGYSHVNNFITAYRNRFGEPPRRHQNGPREG
ncbi:helix-turn-helix transcriptional regulator [Oleisolibacter albus]|uniref:helix-turn-helix transcriptional regulator n=1 Tax=Oleisolibacter albus TaxID=2171757 RepID=UPI0013900CD6|nr:AraC family transcriptional regulator [Oleisolibacter albus]